MARRTNKDKDSEAPAEETVAEETAAEETAAEAPTEGAEAEGAEAEGAAAEGTQTEEPDADTWAAMTPQQKLEHQKAKARKSAQRNNKNIGSRSASGAETIGSVACEAIREGLTNDEVLLRVFEKFPNAKTSIASVTWYRNSLKSAGENIKSSRQIVADRNAAQQAAGEGDDGTTAAPATGSDLSEEDQAALAALEGESDLSSEDLEGLIE